MLFLMMRTCNPMYKEYTLIHFTNNSDKMIFFTIPTESQCKEGFTPDTTMTSYWMLVNSVSLVENASRTIASPVDTYEEWIPRGSRYYSMFVFKWDPQKERELLGYYLKWCFMNDEYYVRYDLTDEDIHSLCDKDGVLNISYPPSPEMKNVKMWPPYEEVIKNATIAEP